MVEAAVASAREPNGLFVLFLLVGLPLIAAFGLSFGIMIARNNKR